MTNDMTPQPSFNTLEEIRMRKDQLSDAIDHDGEIIGEMWNDLFKKPENSTKGEYVATLVTNAITAIDAFLLARKLMKNYAGLFTFFGKNKKKKNR